MKKFKEQLKDEEKTAVRRVESSATRADRKMAVNKAKLELQSRRAEKVKIAIIASSHLILCLSHLAGGSILCKASEGFGTRSEANSQ